MINCIPRIKLFFLIFISIFHYTIDLSGQQKFIFEKPEMGSPFTISIFSKDSAKAAAIAALAFRCADSLNAILSDYIDTSELNLLNSTSGEGRYVTVSNALFDILKYSMQAAQLSDGSYDISMGPVVKLWRKARKENRLPNEDSLKEALNKTGYKYIHLDSVHQSVWLEKKGCG